MKKTALKIISLIGAIFCAVFSLFSSTFAAFPARAEDVPTDYTKTDIMDDLSDVSTALYPKNPLGVPQVIRFQEYCFSEKSFYEMYYGLFVYIYNPTEVPLKTERNFNKLNIATAYDEDGQPTSYDNVRLTYCDSVSNRIYKFYVADSTSILKTAKEYNKAHGKRRYDIAGVQLTHTDGTLTDSQTKDRAYGYTYYFEGYAATCDINNPDAESTLKCSTEKLETIQLDVHQTNYRTGDYQDFVCDELNTVFFSVPDEYFEKYGNLQKIKAEWYEYKTKPVFVTSDSGAYEALKPYIGKDIGNKQEGLDWCVLWQQDRIAVAGDSIWKTYSKTYNDIGSASARCLSRMDWLFSRKGAITNADFKVSKTEMKEYMDWYSENIATDAEKIVGANGEYSVKLFEDSIDADRLHLVKEHNPDATSGYVCQEIDAKDKGSLTVQKDQGFWDKFWNGVQYEQKGYDPIIVLDDSDNLASMDDASFAKTYLVKADEKIEKDETGEKISLLEYCKEEIENNGKVVLFRFAVTDYYASTARFEYTGNLLMSDEDGYVAQETVFLNFDVISLTFRSAEGADVVIGCVADPIDIINGTDPPPDLNNEDDKWALIIGLIFGFAVLVVVLIIIGVYFPNFGTLVLNGGAKVLTGIGNGLKAVGNAFKDVFGGNKKKGGKK
ncbi:MAG: hypothetical protein IJ308_03615 [Clostridia bacterium]|nr:hypothetical protein [Clostridia bacterium]